ncbi:MAG TPA: hypothetical protein PLY94_00860 [Gemmatimonadaceae bacterium]|jgi:hypothetical protein|nr:hypothetical protein [Gemmatimonadaceae bacterium]
MTTADVLPLIRRGVLAVLVFGCVGLIGELVLLEHYAEINQLPPLLLCTAMIVAVIVHWVGNGAKSVRALQVVALMMVLSGALGMYFHGEENLEHATRDAEEYGEATSGSAFWINVVKGDAPALAPGTMIQFGLLALLYAYRHPALKRPEE